MLIVCSILYRGIPIISPNTINPIKVSMINPPFMPLYHMGGSFPILFSVCKGVALGTVLKVAKMALFYVQKGLKINTNIFANTIDLYE